MISMRITFTLDNRIQIYKYICIYIDVYIYICMYMYMYINVCVCVYKLIMRIPYPSFDLDNYRISHEPYLWSLGFSLTPVPIYGNVVVRWLLKSRYFTYRFWIYRTNSSKLGPRTSNFNSETRVALPANFWWNESELPDPIAHQVYLRKTVVTFPLTWRCREATNVALEREVLGV